MNDDISWMSFFFFPCQDGEHYQGIASDGSMGLVHRASFLERRPVPLLSMPWFHGAISRLDAEKLLDRNHEGQFLLRTSQNTKGVYALAVRSGFKGQGSEFKGQGLEFKRQGSAHRSFYKMS